MSRRATFAFLLACAVPAVAEEECLRLVTLHGPATYERGRSEETFAAPAIAGAQWFLAVERLGPGGGHVELNGTKVVKQNDISGQVSFVRVPVQLAASNQLEVDVNGQTTSFRITIQGIVPAASLAPGQGLPVAALVLFETTLGPCGQPGHPDDDDEEDACQNDATVQVSVPATEGLFSLEAIQGASKVKRLRLRWNDQPVLGKPALKKKDERAEAGVRVEATNTLTTHVRGQPGSSVTIRLTGFVVDQVAPSATWTAPLPDAVVGAEDPLVLAFADALSGIRSVRLELNGTDVTAQFDVGPAEARSTPSRLPAVAGENTLRGVVRDRACNETVATVTFRVDAGDTTPPVIEQPPDLVVEQQSPAGSVVTFATPAAVDSADPNPVVTCAPASGSIFPPGETAVVCSAVDASGNAASVSFTVTVVDRTPPVLAQPPDLVVDQASPAGTVVEFATPAAIDSADPNPVVTCLPASGSVFPPGVTTVTCTARDAAGNTASVSFTVTVQSAAAIERLELSIGPPPRGPAPDETPLLELAPEARSLDGSGNDVASPSEGQAGSRFQRSVPSAYADGASAPAGPTRPSARAVSNAVAAQTGSVPNARRATDLLAMWGQFLNHDLSFTRSHTPAEPLPIPLLATDPLNPYGSAASLPFNRSRYDIASSPREQLNELSAWIDASMVYGTDPARAAALRANDGTGRLRTSEGDLLPRNTGGLENQPTGMNPGLFLAGDVRANQTVPLLAMHTLFVREHNRLALLLAARHPGATDEELYQAARRIVTAEIQAITYQEFLPVLLGTGGLAPYAGYRAELSVGIDNLFATAAFRVGHSLVSPRLLRLDAAGNPVAEGPLALRDAFFAPERLTEAGGLEAILRGASRQLAQELDPLVVDEVRTYLFGQPGHGGLDLFALDVQRGRDHGLPGYNDARRQLGLAPRASFAEVTSDLAIRARLASVYADVEQIDLLTGGLCEDHVPGAMVGELFFHLLKRQFELLRDGDRLFYRNAFSGPALAALEQTRLSDVIRRNTAVGPAFPEDPFAGPLLPFTENDFTVRAVRPDGSTATAFEGLVQVSVSDGKPPLDGFVFAFGAADQGQARFPGLAFFRTLGPLTITARTLAVEPGDPEVSGSLAVVVGLEAPAVFPALPPLVPVGGELVIQGLSFVGQQVELVVDGQLVATSVAGAGGEYTLSVRLAPGTHQVQVRAIHPATGVLTSSPPSQVEQAAPPAQAIEVDPTEVRIAVGQTQALRVTQRFADQTTRDVTGLASYGSSNEAVASVTSLGLVRAHTPGSATLTVSFEGFTVHVAATVGVPILVESSPTHGEQGVAVSRETVLRFSAPLDPASVTADAIRAEFAGATLGATLHVSQDGRTVTAFYTQALPVSSRVRVTVKGDLLRDLVGNAIDVDRDGVAGGTALIDFDTLTITVVAGTVAYGRVFSSRLAHEPSPGAPPGAPGDPQYGGGGGGPGQPGDPVVSVNVPLAGAKISVVGAEETLFTFTDELGSFRLDPAPAGTFFVHVEVIDPARRLNYPDIGKPWTTIAGEETSVGDIFLPIVEDGAMQAVSDTQDTTVGFTDALTLLFPHLVGTQITVPAGSLYSTSGSTEEKRVGIAPVPSDRLPAPLPPGLSFSVVFTVQTTGGENFDVPAPVRFPNTAGLPPGAKSALWSFNHDTGEWEVIGSMTVSADGQWVETDPGVGILAPGWHGWQSGAMGIGGLSLEGLFRALRDFLRALANPGPSNGDCPTCRATCKVQAKVGGQSVLLHSGEEHLPRTDLVIPGRGDLSFVFERTYRSRVDYDGPIGRSWDFNYDERLRVEPNGDVSRQNGRARVDLWVRQADGSYRAPPGFFSVLTRAPDGVFTLRERNGLQRLYTPDGLLLSHLDRFGNRMDFVHDELGDLDLVIDTYGREIDFTFQTFADGVRRLTSVKDFARREWIYTYNALGQLTSVRSPIVTGTSTGDDFPAGRTERYTYSSGFANPELNHNLLTITMPEEVARGGSPSLSIVYGTDPDDPLSFDKVIERTEGGTNASGVAVGGRTTIAYALMNQGVPPGDKTVWRKRATIVDPNGNTRTSYVNEDDQHVADRIWTRGLREGEPQFYETLHEFNQDNLETRTIYPAGNEVRYTYATGSRTEQANVIEVRVVAGPRGLDGQGAAAEDLVTTFTYEPLFNRVASVTDPRGNSTSYAPPLGSNEPGRYTTRFFFDYQEHTDPVPLAVELGIDLSSMARGLGDLNGDGRTDQSFGNPIRTDAPPVALVAGSNEAARIGSTTQTVRSETRWNDRGQVIATVDPEGNLATLEYHPEDDPDGDGLRTQSMFRALSQDATGYLARVTADASADPQLAPRRTATTPAAALVSRFRYDPVGNVIAVTNPRGIETQLEVTALNEVVVTTVAADLTLAIAQGDLPATDQPLAYKARAFHDANGRVVRAEVENRDSTTPGVGTHVESTLVYDMLGNVLSATAELDAATRLTTTFRYDPNQNLVLATAPEGNQVASVFDERDLPFTVTRGVGTPQASTIQVDYDLNGNRVRLLDAEDTDGDGEREASTLLYDGFDRLIEARDALGNKALTSYDVASQAVRMQLMGHPAGAPSSPQVLLSDVRLSHDELGRVFKTDAALFLASGFTATRPVVLSDHDGDGLVTTRIERDALSRTTFLVEDDLEVSRFFYDGVSRPIESRDALGNRQLTAYDRNSNAVRVTSVEVSPEGLVPAQTFTTRYVYDQLDRLIRATDNAGQTSRFAYDSRGNLTVRSDPVGPLTADPLGLFPGQINGPGNTCSYVYDGLGRMVRQLCDLRVGGTGAGALDTSNPRNPDGQISLGYVFDGNSRLVGIVDDNGNRTSFGYDALDRRVSQTNADNEQWLTTYDKDDNVKTVTDPNGSVITKAYDVLNRLTRVDVARAPGVGGTTVQTFAYDGASRLVAATDDNGGGVAPSEACAWVFDSLGRVLEERQSGRVVSSQYTGDGKRAKVTYPGGRVISRTFDGIDRIKTLVDGASTQLAASEWIGPGMRELRRVNGNGTKLTFLDDAGSADIGYDSVQRIVRLRCVLPDNVTAFVDRAHTYNRASQRTSETRHDDAGLTDTYTYDSAYRVVSSAFDQAGGAGSVPRLLSAISYQLDGVGNRRQVQKTVSGAQVTEAFSVNAVNEYTSVAGAARTHDDNGNLTDDATRILVWDAFNRLVAVARKSDGAAIAAYSYLPDGRRSRKVVYSQTSPGVVEREVRFAWDGAQEVEEQNAAGVTLATFVWSPVYVDELVEFRRETAHPLGAGSFYSHQDVRCDVVAVTNASGVVVEKRRYDDFGREEIRDAGGAVVAASPSGLEYGFQGRRRDAETGWLYFRARFYDPEVGRFLSRDPVWDAGNVGGWYTFVGNGPVSGRDPSGLLDTGEDWWGNTLAFAIGVATVLAEPVHILEDVIDGSPTGRNNYLSLSFQATEARMSEGQSKAEAGVKIGAEIFVSANPVTGPLVGVVHIESALIEGDYEKAGQGAAIVAPHVVPGVRAMRARTGPRGQSCPPEPNQPFAPDEFGPDFIAELDTAKQGSKHTPFGQEALRDFGKGDPAHVLTEEPVGAAGRVLAEGEYTGTVRGWDRAFLKTEEPVGVRVQEPKGTPGEVKTQPIHGMEVKMKPAKGGGYTYHVDPRPRPATPSIPRNMRQD